MPVYDTTHIDYIIIYNEEKELSIARKNIFEYQHLGHLIEDFDYKSRKELYQAVLNCFCTGKDQQVKNYIIKNDNMNYNKAA